MSTVTEADDPQRDDQAPGSARSQVQPGPGSGRGGPVPVPTSDDPARHVDWRRLKRPLAAVALAIAAVSAVGYTLGTVVAGRIAEHATVGLVGLLAVFVVGGAVLDAVGRTLWASVSDRAEGQLRADLLACALHQPLETLSEQAVGEILDRVDDDTWEVGAVVRRQVWDAFGTVFATFPMWIVAGLTWWPAWFLFPACGVLVVLVVRRLLPEVARLKVEEELAWTDHAAAFEEGVAGRDDVRTSLGQAHVVGRLARLSSETHRRLARVLQVEVRITRRAGTLLSSLLAAMTLVGIALAANDDLSVAQLVTLFLVTSSFVGQVDELARHLPDLQEGWGAVLRLRQLVEAEPEPVGGLPLPDGSLDVAFVDLDFSYAHGSFALQGIDLRVPAGETCALVGRTGSGKSTLASLLSRAVEPPAGAVLLGGVDVLDLDLQQLRAAVGVVTQRTEIIAGTLAQNIALFADRPRAQIEGAVTELGLEEWVGGLVDGLDTVLGPGGTTLSAGEEQLVAFARLLVRDVRVVVLDEATARMDPLTEALVVRASERLLRGRTGILVAHRLGTTARAEQIAVLESGRVVDHGPRAELASRPGPFRTLLEASARTAETATSDPAPDGTDGVVGGIRRSGPAPTPPDPGTGPSLARGIAHALRIRPEWGITGAVLFLLASVTGAFGMLTAFVWGQIVESLRDGGEPFGWSIVLTVSLLAAPLVLASAFLRYPHWWIEVRLRARMSVLAGQTAQHRLAKTPPGEVVARAMDADRYARYADRWVDLINGLIIVVATTVIGGSLLSGGILLGVMVASALASTAGRPIAGRSAAAASAARARFGRALVSALESARTIKLAAATPEIHRHLRNVDGGRVDAAVKEHRVQALLDGVPVVMVQLGVVAAWAVYVADGWGLATALLVSGAVNGFDWFGRVAGSVVTEAPGTRSWQKATARFAGGVDLMAMPAGVDLVTGQAPTPDPGSRVPLQRLHLESVEAVHDDGTRGVVDVDLVVERGELVLLVGQVGSGKSSLLGVLAGLIDHRGSIRWNDVPIDDAQTFLRPGQVAHVAQVPRVLSGTFSDNVRLGHPRPFDGAVHAARLDRDVTEAGGPDSLVGHRGVRLSGGQVQRLALARALAAETELLLADDVSSALDAATEIELWESLRERGVTVIGATSKEAALARADRVAVLVDGQIAAVGPWHELAPSWSHLAG
ncbi:ABC transporter ATP-binding protein [Nocardioides sp. R-C-SC26]|uniref:ATP-binding cassette domain-containing protein n=1 Tax=Nocardioides sp. R-C-SC26 TaxID=2870414 RepID=UPI001E3133ED|nr:ABC transporter ATP-binding protein [Nocardioides sp. R-C-SC26]